MKRLKALDPLYKVLYYIVVFIAVVFVPILFPVRKIGKENLIKGGFVLAPNHISALDPMFVIIARGLRKKMLIMGKDSLFGRSALLDFFWTASGTFPVKRGTGDTGAVQHAVEAVQNGRGMLMFPEGTRSKDGNLGRLKSGAFVVAAQTGMPMIPCRVWYKAGKVKMFNRCTVIFGKPILIAELGLSADYKPADLRAAKIKYAEILEKLYQDNIDKL